MQAAIKKEFIELAHRMADEAGEIVWRYFRTDVAASRKADQSPVTIADRKVETLLRQLIESHYPDHGIIGEEYGNVRSAASLQWVLDPIDGTRSFIAGYPLFAVLIALARDGVPVLGIIYQPITNERWVGIAGQSSTYNGAACSTRRNAALADAVLATTSLDYFTPQQAKVFTSLKSQCASTVYNGDAYAYAMLASGSIDLVVDAGLKTYDFSALIPIIEGAGGLITDWNGKPLTLKSDGNVIAAATSELHQQALTFLRPAA